MAQERGIIGLSFGPDVLAPEEARLEQPEQGTRAPLPYRDLPPRRLGAAEDRVPGGGETLGPGPAAQAIDGLARHPGLPRRPRDRSALRQCGKESHLASGRPAIAARAQRDGDECGNADMAGGAARRIMLHRAG